MLYTLRLHGFRGQRKAQATTGDSLVPFWMILLKVVIQSTSLNPSGESGTRVTGRYPRQSKADMAIIIGPMACTTLAATLEGEGE